LKLTTGEATVVACDVLGKIEFQAPAECGTDAIVAGANIQAVAQATFSATVNNTDLLFMTGLSGAATEKFRFTASGELGVGGANYGTDGQVLTSAGACQPPAWEDAGGGGLSAASQTEMEAASSNTVAATPGRTNFHPGVAKGWADWVGTGTAALSVSYNVASLDDDAVGKYTINWDTDFSGTHYSVVGWCEGNRWIGEGHSQAPSAALTETITRTAATSTLADSDRQYIVAFGDQ